MLADAGSPKADTSRSSKRREGRLGTQDFIPVLPVPQARDVWVK